MHFPIQNALVLHILKRLSLGITMNPMLFNCNFAATLYYYAVLQRIY